MKKLSSHVSVSVKVPRDLKDEFFDTLEEHGMDASKWFRESMKYYIDTYGELPTMNNVLKDKDIACTDK